MHSFKHAIRATALVLAAVCIAGVEIAPVHAVGFPERRALNRAAALPAGIPGHWKLVLDSRFDGRRLPSQWRSGWRRRGITAPVNSREIACYSPANVNLPGDGTLHLDVTAASSRCRGIVRPYTGAIVSTDPHDGRATGGFEYTYGVLQVRAYVPGTGARIADWPAVWTDGQHWPLDGEDDLMEGILGRACFHFHDSLGAPGGCDALLSPGWHTFASDWRPGVVTYYYDGVRVGAVTTGVTAQPMYIVLDNTVSVRGLQVNMADSLRVRYVRVWQQA